MFQQANSHSLELNEKKKIQQRKRSLKNRSDGNEK